MIDWLGKKWTVPMALAVVPVGGCGDDENPDAGTETQAPTTGGESSGSADDDGVTASTGADTASTSGATGSDADTGSGDASGDTDVSDSGTASDSTGSGDDTGGETGEALPCASILDEAECGAEMYCAWSPPGYCFTNCSEIPDLATCVAQLECIWVGDEACEFGGV